MDRFENIIAMIGASVAGAGTVSFYASVFVTMGSGPPGLWPRLSGATALCGAAIVSVAALIRLWRMVAR